MKTTYKHIRFIKADKTEEGKPKWLCINKEGESLADVTYYPEWRKYVDEREPCVVFDSSCNTDMGHFLKQLDEQHKLPPSKSRKIYPAASGQQ